MYTATAPGSPSMYTAVALEVTLEDADQAEQENRLTGIARV